MNNTQALYSLLTIEPPEFLVEKVLIDNGVDGTANYTSSDYATIELCSAYVYKTLATQPDEKQGSLAITNAQAKTFLKLANDIFIKYGKKDEVVGVKISLIY